MPVITCPDCGRDVSPLATACPHCGRPSPAGFAAPAAAQATGAPALTEETLWRGSPSWRILIAKIVMMVLTAIVILFLANFISGRTADLDLNSKITNIGRWLTALVLLYQIITFLFALMRLQSTLYTVTNQRIMFEQGILSKSLSEIDLRSLDDTQFFQSFSDRILGIGNVTLVSSDKTLPVTVLRGVHDPRGLREIIRSRAYQVSQRQVFTRAT